jgi:hypothetical protein
VVVGESREVQHPDLGRIGDSDDSHNFRGLRASVLDGEVDHDGQAAWAHAAVDARTFHFLAPGHLADFVWTRTIGEHHPILEAATAIVAAAQSGNKTAPGPCEPTERAIFDQYFDCGLVW